MRKSFRDDKVWMGPYSVVETARDALPESAQVTLRDLTLREGAQAADVTFTIDDKVRLVQELRDLGVSRIQVGMPGRSDDDTEVFRKLKGMERRPTLDALALAYTGDWRQQVSKAVEVEADMLDVVFPISDYRVLGIMDMSREEVNERISTIVSTAARDIHVVFTPSDATRTAPQHVQDACKAAVEAGAREVSIPDTVGIAIPHVITSLVRAVLAAVNVPVGVHVHNDLGLAMANAVAGVEAGASVVDVCLNGLGERIGSVSVDEAAVVFQELYQLPLGIRTEELSRVSQLVQTLTEVPVPATKPLLGAQAFAHKLDTHIEGVLKYMPAYQPIDTSLIGRRLRIVLGTTCGPVGVQAKAEELGWSIGKNDAARLAEAVRDRAKQQRAAMTDEQFVELMHSREVTTASQ